MSKARVFVVLVIAAAAGAGYWYWTRTPEYALRQIRKSVEQRDLVRFRKYVDVEGAISRFADDALSFAKENMESQASEKWEALGEQLGKGMLPFPKPQIVDAAKGEIERYVETGDYMDYGAEQAGESVYGIAELLRQTGLEAKSFAGVASVRKEEGAALATVDVIDERHDTTLAAEIRLQNMGSHWQVVGSHWQVAEIANLPELLRALERLEERRVGRLNEPLEKRVREILRIGRGIVKLSAGEYGIGRFVQFRFHIANTGHKDISTFDGEIIASTEAGQEIKRFIVSSAPLLARDRNTFRWTFDLNAFDPADTQLYDTPVALLVPELSIRHIEFANGSVLRYHDKWEPLQAGP